MHIMTIKIIIIVHVSFKFWAVNNYIFIVLNYIVSNKRLHTCIYSIYMYVQLSDTYAWYININIFLFFFCQAKKKRLFGCQMVKSMWKWMCKLYSDIERLITIVLEYRWWLKFKFMDDIGTTYSIITFHWFIKLLFLSRIHHKLYLEFNIILLKCV